MTLWCVFRSTLMMGGVLPEMDEWTLSLLTNARLVRLIKHSHGARICRDDTQAVWHTFDEDGSEYGALFHLADEERAVEASAPKAAPRKVTELWERETLLLSFTRGKVPAHGAVWIGLE